MTFILNEFDIESALLKSAHDFHRPNAQAAALTLARLMEWTNSNSDGWAYWKKPSTAATKLQTLVQLVYGHRGDMHADLTAAELKAAYTPIKAFLTRQGFHHRAVFINE